MRNIKRSRVVAVVAGAAVIALVAGGSGAYAGGLITSAKIKDNTIQSRDVKNGGLGLVDLTKTTQNLILRHGATGPKGATGATGATGAAGADGVNGTDGVDGAVGPAGPAGVDGSNGSDGSNGADATVTVTGGTLITDHNDSGHHGPWAHTSFLRDASVTRQHAAKSSNCGGADNCYFYTGQFTDSGSLVTIAGASSPNAGVDINGVLGGTVNGVQKFEFYSTDETPDASGVPGEASNGFSSADWLPQFLEDGSVHGLNETSYAYTYAADGCETWVESNTNNDGQGPDAGDITGVNHCVSAR